MSTKQRKRKACAVSIKIPTTEHPDMKNGKRYLLVLSLALITTSLYFIKGMTSTNNVGKQFFCGQLGEVWLTANYNIKYKTAGRFLYQAELSIPSKKLSAKGFIHNFMGGNDKIFTYNAQGNFRQPDETTKDNPINLTIRSGYVYGKRRSQITIYLIDEAHTCIISNQQSTTRQ